MKNSAHTQYAEARMRIVQALRHWLPRVGPFLWLCFCGLMVTALASDLVQLYMTPQDYAMLFGSEATHGFWQYSSFKAYVLHGFLLTSWFLAGIPCALGWRPLRRAWMLPMHVTLTLLYLAYMQR